MKTKLILTTIALAFIACTSSSTVADWTPVANWCKPVTRFQQGQQPLLDAAGVPIEDEMSGMLFESVAIWNKPEPIIFPPENSPINLPRVI